MKATPKQGLLSLLVALLCTHCSAVQGRYVQPGYPPVGGDRGEQAVVKRISVAAWADAKDTGLADVLTAVGGDLIKLRKNYLVYPPMAIKQSWAEGCQAHVTGVILIRVLGLEVNDQEVAMRLAMELYRCDGGALLWRAETAGRRRSSDEHLNALTSSYTSTLGTSAALYAAPAFSLLQDLVAALPEPELDEADILEKIELGRSLSKIVTPLAQAGEGLKGAFSAHLAHHSSVACP